MSLSVNSQIELTPDVIAPGRSQTVSVKYAVGGSTGARACDRIVVGGVERPDKQCFPVTGTRAFKQAEIRSVVVTPPAGTDFVRIEVFVREVDASNAQIPGEQELQCSAQLGIRK